MENGNNEKKQESVYSKRIKAGKRRTYFFDVRETRGNDYYLTITESRKRFDSEGYDRHKIFLYKEDFNKFVKGLGEAVDYVKTDLMPDFDFDAFNHDTPYEGEDGEHRAPEAAHVTVPEEQEHPIIGAPAADIMPTTPIDESTAPHDAGNTEEVDKW